MPYDTMTWWLNFVVGFMLVWMVAASAVALYAAHKITFDDERKESGNG